MLERAEIVQMLQYNYVKMLEESNRIALYRFCGAIEMGLMVLGYMKRGTPFEYQTRLMRNPWWPIRRNYTMQKESYYQLIARICKEALEVEDRIQKKLEDTARAKLMQTISDKIKDRSYQGAIE